MIRILILLLVLLLSGCAHNKPFTPEPLPDLAIIQDVNPIQIIKSSDYKILPDDLERLSNLDQIDVKMFESVKASTFFLNLPDRNFVVDVRPELLLTVPQWKGSLKGLLYSLQKTAGLFFYVLPSGEILVRDTATCAVRVIYQNDEARLVKLLTETFGVKNVNYDRTSGYVLFNSDARQYSNVIQYLKNMPITFLEMEIAFLETELTGKSDVGLDIEDLSLVIGNSVNGLLSIKSVVSGFQVEATKGVVNLTALLHYLEKNSKIEVIQKTTLGALSGNPVVLDVSKKIPYVKDITVTAGESGAAVRGYQFDTETSGMVLNVVGISDNEFVSLANNLKFQQIIEFLEVGSGQDKVSRPVVAVRNLSSTVTMKPGAVVRLASFIYERKIDTRSGFIKMPSALVKNENDRVEISVLARVVLKKYIYE